jgi:ATP-binding cassette subfamily F protein 3
MPIVAFTSVRFGHGTRLLLDEATVSIEPGEKIGLVGRNGCGKSTLLKLIAGRLRPDAGTVAIQRGVRVGFLTQDPDINPDDTLREAAARAFTKLSEIRHALHELYEQLALADEGSMQRLLDSQARLEHELEAAGGYAIDHRIDAVLHGLGFTDAQFGQRVATLSGGQRARAGLARLLLEEPDILLLDEPTNHLDIEGRRWLEEFLADEFPGAVIVVSHDRWLLDRVVTRIIEIHDAGIREYPGNYADFTLLRRQRALTQQRVHEKQQDRIAREEAYIARYKAGQRARQAKGRATRLERFQRDELVERPIDFDVMRLELPRAERVGDIAVACSGLSKGFGTRTLITGLDLALKPGDRLGIVGANGTGKTTLVRVLLGEEPPGAGIVKSSPRLSIGWFRQNQDHLDQSLEVWRHLQLTVPRRRNGARLSEQEARDLAGAFLFSGSAQEAKIGSLSGGERARAVLAGLVAGAHNLLVLDEPSNHLDIPSAERLEQALSLPPDEGGYDGTLILVSHDRALLAATCDQILSLDGDGRWTHFQGNYAEFDEQRRKTTRPTHTPEKTPTRPASPVASPEPPRTPARSTDRTEKPRTQAKRPSRALQEVERSLAAMTAKIAALDERMGHEETYRDRAKTTALLDQRGALERQRASLEAEWLRLAERDA